MVAGQRFGVFNGDAKGTILSANTLEVSFRYDHDLEKIWSTDAKHFNSFTYPA